MRSGTTIKVFAASCTVDLLAYSCATKFNQEVATAIYDVIVSK